MDINFTVADKGRHFVVLLFEDYVVKIPKNLKQRQDTKWLDFIANSQTYLAEKIEGVLPCERVDNFLVMPRAQGIRVDLLPKHIRKELKEHIDKKRGEILIAIQRCGFRLDDVCDQNMFYHRAEDKLYIIDYGNLRKV